MEITGYDIELEGIHIYAHHGVMPQEREIGACYVIEKTLTKNDSTCTNSHKNTGTVSNDD